MFLTHRGKVVAFAAIILVQLSEAAAAGNCLSKADGFQLNSDTVYWSFTIRSASECLQGLRASSMLIDEVKVLEPPAAGSLTIAGPAFFYKAPATASGDRFKLQVLGQNHRIRGASTIVVEVVVR
jgi:hypothetical protein